MVLPTWWKNGKHLDNIKQTSHNSLIIQEATVDDEGSYSCETLQVYENNARKQNLTFDVQVIGKYSFTINKTNEKWLVLFWHKFQHTTRVICVIDQACNQDGRTLAKFFFAFLLYGRVSQGLGTTKFANLIG